MVQTARDQVVAGPLRRRAGQHRRLDVDEALFPEVREGLDREIGPQPQVALQAFPPQIEEAVLEARLLARVLRALHREGHRLGTRQDPALPDLHLDLAGRHLRVDLVRVAPYDLALDLDDVLETRGVQGLGRLQRALRVDDRLDDAAPVADVEEDHAAVIAAAVDPPLDLRLLADLVGGQGSCFGSLHFLIRCAVLLAGPAFRANRRRGREAPDPRTTTALRGRRSSLRPPPRSRPARSSSGCRPGSPSAPLLRPSPRPLRSARPTGIRAGWLVSFRP